MKSEVFPFDANPDVFSAAEKLIFRFNFLMFNKALQYLYPEQ
jgi:hypothetical protein